jgi:hypothetical protein
MDLFPVIGMNLATALILYLLFSRRFSIAVDRARKESRLAVIRELRENIENTIRYMDDSLEIIDKKINTFYSLLRRSEEVATRLEELSAQSDKKSTKVKRSKGGERTPKIDGESAPRLLKIDTPEAHTAPEPEGVDGETEPTHLLQLLNQYDDDRLEISGQGATAEELYRRGELTRRAAITKKSERPARERDASPLLEKLGGVFGRMFGMERFETGLPDDPRREEELEGADRKSPESAPARKGDGDFPLHLNRELKASDERRTETPTRPQREDRVEISMTPEKTLDQHIADLESGRYEKGMNHFIKMLLRSGFDTNEISKRINMSPAQIELIASLPDTGYRPRRERIARTENDPNE